MILRNGTRGISKVGFLVKTSSVHGYFEYAGIGDDSIGVVSDAVGEGQECNIITSGPAKVYSYKRVVIGGVIRQQLSTDGAPRGALMPLRGASEYVPIGTSLSTGRGLVDAIIQMSGGVVGGTVNEDGWEPYLGLPTTTGHVLSSTALGERSWIDPSSGMVYPAAGIALSTGSAWGTSITNNSTSWNTAYTHSLVTTENPHNVAWTELTGLRSGITLSGFNDDLSYNNYALTDDLTSAEIAQLQNINLVTISNVQWGYLGALDQSLTQASSPTFASVLAGKGSTASADGDVLLQLNSDRPWQFKQVGNDGGAQLTLGPTGSSKEFRILNIGGGIQFRSTDTYTYMSYDGTAKVTTTATGADITGNLGVSGDGSITGDLYVETDAEHPDFALTTDFSGTNWQMTAAGDLNIANLVVRESARFRELIIDQLSVIAGSTLLSAARGKIESANNTAKTVTLEDPNSTNSCQFAVSDFFWIKSIDVDGGVFLDLKGQVTAVTENVLTLDTTVAGGTHAGLTTDLSALTGGEVIVQRGHPTTAARQNLIYTTVSDTDAPVSKYFTGITSLAAFDSVANITLQTGNLASLASHDIVPASPGYGIYSDNAYLKGTIVASLGEIGGWEISATEIKDTAGVVGLSSAVTAGDDIRFWAGHATPASAPFSVTEAGVLKATSGVIGGFTISSTDGLYSGTGVTRVQMKPGAGIWAGATAIGDAPFSVTNAGALKATSGEIGGWTIDDDAIYTGTKKVIDGYSADGITLDAAGAIHAKNFHVDSDGDIGIRANEIVYGYAISNTYLVNIGTGSTSNSSTYQTLASKSMSGNVRDNLTIRLWIKFNLNPDTTDAGKTLNVRITVGGVSVYSYNHIPDWNTPYSRYVDVTVSKLQTVAFQGYIDGGDPGDSLALTEFNIRGDHTQIVNEVT